MSQSPLVPAAPSALAPGLAHMTSFVLHRSWWSMLDRTFRVRSPEGALVLFVKHPLLKLREEFTAFADESQRQAVLTIRARQIIGIDIAYDVFDAPSGQRVGTIKKRGLRSILRDRWDILDTADQPAGLVQEVGLALLRRFFPILLGSWEIQLGGQVVATLNQRFRWFSKEFQLDLVQPHGRIDPRFAVACALLALMAEVHREERR